MNTNFGRIYKNKFEYAPDAITDKNTGASILNPIARVYQNNGWYKILNQPEDKPGYAALVIDWKLDHIAKTMKLTYSYSRTNASRKISKIYLKIVLAKYGILNDFINWLKSVDIDLGGGAKINAYDAFETCLVIDEGDPLFAPYIKNAKLAFGLTDQMYENLISKCIAAE